MSFIVCIILLGKRELVTVKPALDGHSKIDKTTSLITTGSLMKVESIAAFCNAFDLHLGIIGLETQFLAFLRGTVLHRFYCTLLYLSSGCYMTARVLCLFFLSSWVGLQ